MSERITIQSHRGPYEVQFCQLEILNSLVTQLNQPFYLVDRQVANLYSEEIATLLKSERCALIDANESIKSLEAMPKIIENLLQQGLKRGHNLVAVGGGITQDIACFIASTLFRGLDWYFVPTTLLAQADSCIGSKSSINLGSYKNIVGTFLPPKKIFLTEEFLRTLESQDIRSGIGEMIKVHKIHSQQSFFKIENDYQQILSNPKVMKHYIRDSLLIKKEIIEHDEFDHGLRNIMNYGHSFGHAIESATHFSIPHGIAVTMGMDFANFAAWQLGRTSKEHYSLHRPLLKLNSNSHWETNIEFEIFYSALLKDKKNSSSHLNLILPNAEGKIEKVAIESSPTFQSICKSYLNEGRGENVIHR